MRKEFDVDAIGIESDKSPVSEELRQSTLSYNVTFVELQGTGPRYGMSPIPGQYHSESSKITLTSSEGATTGYSNRKKCFGIFTQKLSFSGTPLPYPFFICASERSSTFNSIDLIFTGTATGPTADVASGLLDSSLGTLDNALKNWRLVSLDSRKIDATLANIRVAQMSIGLADINVPFQLVDQNSGETSTKPGPLNYSTHGYDFSMSRNKITNMKIHSIFQSSSKYYFGREYIYDAQAQAWTAPTHEGQTGAHFTPGTSDRQVVRLTTPSYADGSGPLGLVIADNWKAARSHAISAFAFKSALIAVMRDELDSSYLPVQYADPQDEGLSSTRTLAEGLATSYLENSLEKSTVWARWPTWTGSALGSESGAAYDGSIHVRLGAADSGLLRKNNDYEITYSIYDYTIDTETNVGEPARITTGSDDYVAFSIFRNEKSGGIFTQRCGRDLNLPFQSIPIEKVNYIQIRIYYRGLGSQEWLPAKYIWASDLLFNGQNTVIWCAQDAIGAQTGGAPGQFNDYSPLPRDSWIDVVTFQNRLFWMSSKQAIFSLRNNAFCYPLRNSISIPSGEFRGITVHVFYGQSQQNGRVVFWASDAQYEGRFTGNMITYPVSVSPDFTATFPLDGSDFVITFRSSITAFSSRSAVVAEGMLFFWGEGGMYADDGVNPPNKISNKICNFLGVIYDNTQTSKIHCLYDATTKEIWWFYPPTVNSIFVFESIVLNVEKNEFTRFGFNTNIDWSQPINLSQEGARKRLSCGIRMALGHSYGYSMQRPIFFDEVNDTGDLKHGAEFFVKKIEALASGSRLTLAAGFDVDRFADIPVGEYFLISQSFDYSENESHYDGRYSIVDIGTYYFDIEETLDAATFDEDKYIPIWVDKYSSIPFKLRTKFTMIGNKWEIFSLNFIALSLRLSANIITEAVPQIFQNFNVGIFSNLNKTPVFQELVLEQNATSHCIRQLSFPSYDESTQGIGIGIEINGNVNGSNWRLDWLGFECDKIEQLDRFGQ